MKLQKLFQELKRRNVVKTAGAYAVAAWLLIQIAATIEEPLNLPDWLDTATIIAVLVGFPIALIVSWVFELTPEGLQKTEEVDVNKSATYSKTTGRKLNRITIGALSLVIVLLLTERFYLASSELFVKTEASIAVLPFVNMSSDPENEYFSDGLSEELLNRLAEVKQLKVIGRASSFMFKGKDTSYEELRDILNIDHVLEGSVRKEGDQLRISASLVRTIDGVELWSESYDRKLESVFAIQTEVSKNVISNLKVELSLEEQLNIEHIPTENMKAYELYLLAEDFSTQGKTLFLDSSIYYYKEAIKLDPNFGKAYSSLAYALAMLTEYNEVGLSKVESQVRDNIERALFINPEDAKAYEALGYLYRRQSLAHSFEFTTGKDTTNINKSLEAYLKANEYAPNDAGVLSQIAWAYGQLGDNDKRLEYSEKSFRLNPTDLNLGGNHAVKLAEVGRANEAIQVLEKLQVQYPLEESGQNLQVYWQEAFIKTAHLNQIDSGFIAFYKAYRVVGAHPRLTSNLIELSTILGLHELAEDFLNQAEEKNTVAYFKKLAFLRSAQGNPESALSIVKDHLKDELGVNYERFLNLKKAESYFYNEELESAKNLIRADLTLGDNPYFNSIYRQRFLALLLHSSGQVNEANHIIETTIDSSLELDKRNIQAIKFDLEVSSDLANDEYFSQKARSKYYFLYDLSSPKKIYLDEMGAYRKIRLDRNEMRRHIIDYLKEIGDWNPNWEVNDQVLFSKRPSHLAKLKERDLGQTQ